MVLNYGAVGDESVSDDAGARIPGGHQLNDLFSSQHMESNPVFNGCPSVTFIPVLPKVPLLSEASRFRDLPV